MRKGVPWPAVCASLFLICSLLVDVPPMLTGEQQLWPACVCALWQQAALLWAVWLMMVHAWPCCHPSRTNKGPQSAPSPISFTDTLPAGLQFIGPVSNASGTPGGKCGMLVRMALRVTAASTGGVVCCWCLRVLQSAGIESRPCQTRILARLWCHGELGLIYELFVNPHSVCHCTHDLQQRAPTARVVLA